MAIGDVHGCSVALRTLLRIVQPSERDVLIMLGDLVDRGPDSKGVIEILLKLESQTNLIVIRGNHDDLMLDSIDRGEPRLTWIAAGGLATLESYGGQLTNIPAEHVQSLRRSRDYFETESHIFVHACVDPDRPMTQQDLPTLRWEKLSPDMRRHCSGKQLICGHTSLYRGRPALNDAVICIDTKAYAGQWLTCLDSYSNSVWQANQLGETRGPLPLHEVSDALTGVL